MLNLVGHSIIIVLLYHVYMNANVRDNSIHECAPVAKFVNIINCKNFATYGIFAYARMWVWVCTGDHCGVNIRTCTKLYKHA